MQYSPARIFVVSGLGGMTSQLYHRLKDVVPAEFPDDNIVFVGNPFVHWPHPFQWTPEQQTTVPCARLLSGWGSLADFLNRKVAPVLKRNGKVVMQHMGFSLLDYATADMLPPPVTDDAIREREAAVLDAESMHHENIVPAIVKKAGFPLPQYIIPCATPADVSDEWKRRTKLMSNVDCDAIRRLVAHEQRSMMRYFDKKHGQREPVRLDANLSLDEMTVIAVGEMAKFLRSGNETAVA